MLIIGQDKRYIINFDGIFELSVAVWSSKNDFALEPDCWCIKADKLSNSRNSYFLGQYKTEERAKEVLEEIINKYTEYATVKNNEGDIRQVCCDIPKIYQMPEE